MAEFLKKYECSATADELITYLEKLAAENKELSQEDLSQVAGGLSDKTYIKLAIVSVTTLLGCTIIGVISAAIGANDECFPDG